MYSQARYVMSRYLTYYPAGKMAEQAGRYLESAEASLARYGDGRGPAPLAGSTSPSQAATAVQFDEQSDPKPAVKPQEGQRLSDTAKDYYNAVSLFSQGKYPDALKELKAIAESANDPEYITKAQFDIGRCLFSLGQWDNAIQHYTSIVQGAPKHPDMSDILYIMGQSWEKKWDTQRARGFFKKVLSMPGDEDSSARIKAKKALNALGGANV